MADAPAKGNPPANPASLGLPKEALRACRIRSAARWTQASGAALSLISYSLQPHETRLLFAAAGGLAGALISHVSARRWRARHAWYASTPGWQLKQEQMPDIRTFPRLEEWASQKGADRRFLKRVVFAGLALLAAQIGFIVWLASKS